MFVGVYVRSDRRRAVVVGSVDTFHVCPCLGDVGIRAAVLDLGGEQSRGQLLVGAAVTEGNGGVVRLVFDGEVAFEFAVAGRCRSSRGRICPAAGRRSPCRSCRRSPSRRPRRRNRRRRPAEGVNVTRTLLSETAPTAIWIVMRLSACVVNGWARRATAEVFCPLSRS